MSGVIGDLVIVIIRSMIVRNLKLLFVDVMARFSSFRPPEMIAALTKQNKSF